MPYTGSGPIIDLPPLEPRPWGQFIRSVPEFNPIVGSTDRTAAGVSYMTLPALSPQIQDLDCDTADEALNSGNLSLTPRTQAAFRIWNLLENSTLCHFKRDNEEELLESDARALVSEALTRGLLTRITTDHLNLADDSDSVGTAAGIVAVMGLIELGLAQRISNSQGYIFVPPQVLPAARSAGVVKLSEDGLLRSPAGHIVISDAGHDVQTVVYATAQLEYSLLGPKTLGGPNDGGFAYATNDLAWLTEAYGLVVFNPAFSVRATIT